ncbi:MAG: FlgO family outer membrane protein [Thermodesulfobacteriota bacterium]|nr:FlgO family outer membrane protein [Thermodesulfobacteriota bacterium]
MKKHILAIIGLWIVLALIMCCAATGEKKDAGEADKPQVPEEKQDLTLAGQVVRDLAEKGNLGISRKVAVVPLKNLGQASKDDAELMVEELTNAMINEKVFTVVERSQLGNVLNEIKLSATGVLSDDAAQKFGSISNVELLLIGTYCVDKGKEKLSVRLVQVKDGVALSTATASAPISVDTSASMLASKAVGPEKTTAKAPKKFPEKQNWNKVIQRSIVALKKNPRDARARIHLGIAYYKTGRIKNAREQKKIVGRLLRDRPALRRKLQQELRVLLAFEEQHDPRRPRRRPVPRKY